MPEETGELFAVVSRIMGGPHIRVTCSDGTEKLCIIRRKFRGRHKRSNEVSPGSLVLVGLRHWTTNTATKGPQCDLLHVYSPDQARTFAKKSLLDKQLIGLVAAAGDINAVNEVNDELVFSGDIPVASDNEQEESDSGTDDDDKDNLLCATTDTCEAVETLVAGPEVNLDDI